MCICVKCVYVCAHVCLCECVCMCVCVCACVSVFMGLNVYVSHDTAHRKGGAFAQDWKAPQAYVFPVYGHVTSQSLMSMSDQDRHRWD